MNDMNRVSEDIDTYLRSYCSQDAPGAWIDTKSGQVHMDLDFESPVASAGQAGLPGYLAIVMPMRL